jgi:hypothetical protein
LLSGELRRGGLQLVVAKRRPRLSGTKAGQGALILVSMLLRRFAAYNNRLIISVSCNIKIEVWLINA